MIPYTEIVVGFEPLWLDTRAPITIALDNAGILKDAVRSNLNTTFQVFYSRPHRSIRIRIFKDAR